MITSVNNGRIVNVTAIIGSNNVSVGDNIIPSKSDLAFRTTRRNGLTLTDAFGNNATILLPCFLASTSGHRITGDNTRDSEKILDGNSYTIYYKVRQVNDIDNAVIVSFGGGLNAVRRGLEFRAYYERYSVFIADGAVSQRYDLVLNINTNMKDQGVFDVICQINYDTKRVVCGVYDSDNNLIGTESDIDISGYTFNNDDNFEDFTFTSEYFVIENMKKFTGLKTLEQCQADTYRTDLQIHLANVFSAADISGNAQDFLHISITSDDIYYDNLSTWLLDYGFDRYGKLADNIRRHIPRDASGNSYAPTHAGGDPWYSSRIMAEVLGNDFFINMVDCKIRFTHAFFDRSNVTIWGASARAGYYDSSNKKDFHISELNQRTLQEWLNDGYKGRLFIHMNDNSIESRDRIILKEIFLYSTDKTGTNHKSILEYTNDAMAAILDTSGDITYSGNYVALGYLKTTKPMFTLRIDDGYDNAYDDWRSVFNGLNVNPSMNIHSELVGTTQALYTFMTWAEIRTLISEGWEITSSGKYDNDWALVWKDTVAPEVSGSKSTTNNQGIICNHLIPNKHGMDNISCAYFAHKYNYKTCHVGYDYGSVNGTNPQIIDIWNLCAMSTDLAGIYNLDQILNATEIQNCKDQIDLCVSGNRWAIFYLHAYNATISAAITEVINYAIAQGVANVTMDEALENTKYL